MNQFPEGRFIDATGSKLVCSVTDLGHLAEHRSGTFAHQKVAGIACRRIGGNPAESIAATALETDKQSGQGKFLPSPRLKDGEFLLRHLHHRLKHAGKPMLLLQDNHVLRVVLALRKQQIGPEVLAAEADDKQLAAEVRVVHQIPDGPDGNLASRSIDVDTTPIDVVQCHDIIHVRILRKQFLFHFTHRRVHHTLATLDRTGNGKDVAAACPPLSRYRVSSPGRPLGMRQPGMDVGTPDEAGQIRGRRNHHLVLVDPLPLAYRLGQETKHHTVTDDGRPLLHVAQGDLMRLRDIFKQGDVPFDLLAFPQVAQGDDNSIFLVDLYGCGHGTHCSLRKESCISQKAQYRWLWDAGNTRDCAVWTATAGKSLLTGYPDLNKKTPTGRPVGAGTNVRPVICR